jgi:cytochrome c oxidase cbb3-type subunit 3
MGPALMDAQWLYGSEPAQVAASIVDGRPNGMPPFRDRIPEPQVWQLVAYLRSLSGLAPQYGVSARSDHMQYQRQALPAEPRRPTANR